MKAGGGSDSDPDEKEAADQELLRDCQLTHSQVFTPLASWKPDIPPPLFRSTDGNSRGEGRRKSQNENIVRSFNIKMTP